VWDATVFTKNHKRLLSQVLLSVDETEIEAWASIKSFRATDKRGLRERIATEMMPTGGMPPATLNSIGHARSATGWDRATTVCPDGT